MDTFIQDLRYSIRMILKKPGFTFVVVLALALGIGANTAIFSVVNAVLLRPLPYRDPGQLVWIWESNATAGIKQEPASIPNFADWKDQGQSFEDVAAFDNTSLTLTSAAEPERIVGAVVTANLFSVLGVEPALGRNFTAEENKPGNTRVVIISHSFWQRRFGLDPGLVGQTITLNGNPFTVVGVMPQGFKNPVPGEAKPAEVWVPLTIDLNRAHRSSDFLSVVARLQPGVGMEAARAEMDAIASRLAEQYPNTNAGWGVTLLSLHERFVGNVRAALLLLMGVVVFLLLISSANVANLLLARAAARQQEITIRTALGARRGRLVRQFLTESLVLALLGGTLGVLLAIWGVEVLVALAPVNIPRLDEISLDTRIFGFTLGVSLLTGLVFGLFPALHATKPNLNEALKEGGRSSAEGIRSGRLRNFLVVAEISLALVLLIGAGLMIKSFMRLQDVNPGFNPDRVLAMELLLPRSKYQEGPQVAAFLDQVLGRVSALPGVESVGLINALPLSGGGAIESFSIEGRPEPPPEQVMDAERYIVSANYFPTMGISLLKGEGFADIYSGEGARVVIINETMARRHWPDEDPIGKRITSADPQNGPWFRIIGVVQDVAHYGVDKEPYPQMYIPPAAIPPRSFALVVRSASHPLNMVPAIRSEIWAVDKDQAVANVRTMEDVFSASISQPRFNMLLVAIFAAVGLILAAVGIYGVMSYTVTQRTREIGIRMALGAKPGDVMRLVVGQAGILALTGVGIGILVALALTRVMASLLYNVSTTDPITFIAIPVLISLIALVASYVPARRAMKVDPMVALRYE